MAKDDELIYGPLRPETTAHLCVDMQRLFAEDTPWKTPWMPRVAPNIVRLVEPRPERTVFTRFIPAMRPGEGQGTWKRYYERWADVTVERIGRDMVDLIPQLRRFAPPAHVIDKPVYSPWANPALQNLLQSANVDTVLVSGGETDVCVLAAVLGAVDRGYRVVVATDALCSSSDETHDAMMKLYHERYGQQVETACVSTILAGFEGA
ncbi:cysteine hydrolase [Alsobacter soli]|uniref:Cysteine hydrolase n=1 Tax=Alsobacter soli TaxID=2109933 RepID=A0A2T1HUR9_9HYPH|nr:isochorismatase family cysteine hydrolase [Alsobacter soli]PSC05413.1 cysteine hydrolase [Alsobacter soli]